MGKTVSCQNMILRGFMVVVVFVCFTLNIDQSYAQSDKPLYELKVNLQFPAADFRFVDGFKPLEDRIEKASGGKVKFVNFFSSALSPPTETYQSVVDGIADLCWTPTGYYAGRFPMSDVLYLYQFQPIKRASRIFWELYKEFPELRAEYADTKVLFLQSTIPQGLETAKKRVTKLEDLKGLKMYGSGQWAVPQIKALGMSPVILPFPEIYLGVQKKTLDGCASCSEIYLKGRNFADIMKYHMEVQLNLIPIVWAMNLETWNKLPPEIQKIIDDNCGENYVDSLDVAEVNAINEAREFATAKGVEFVKISDEELDRWKKAVEPVRDQYIAALEAKGLPGKKYVARFIELVEQYAK